MSKKLAIILGAGASNSQNPSPKSLDNQDYRPPLARDIFLSIRSFAAILHKYPPAETLASDINTRLRQNKSGLGLEQILKKYEERILKGEDSYITRQFLYIPLYLNDLFGEISQHFTPQPDEYNTLVNRVLDKANEVLFLTLNYDTLLEIPLSKSFYVDFSQLDHYISDPKWSLVKLHGSINWYRAFTSSQSQSGMNEYLENIRRQPIVLPLAKEYLMFPIPGHQKILDGNTPIYPAITVPVDGKYDLNCPPEMLEKAKDFLKECQNYLIIGTSGNDKDLLDLLRENAKGGRTLIVSHSMDSVPRSQLNFLQHVPQLGNGFRIYQHNRGFSQFIDSGEIDTFLDELN